jgi:ribosomal-protein-serine acetyltransferase
MFALRVDDEVEIRLLEERHADELYGLVDVNREHLRPWLPWVDGTRSAEDTRAFNRTSLEGFAAGRAYAAALRYRGQLAGGIGLDVDVPMRRGEIGYWVAQTFVGRGIVTRAAGALTGAAFGDLGLNRVQILCATHNVRSCAVAERLGFRKEGTLRGFERVGERFHDIAIYGMLAREWPAKAEGEG